MPGRALLKQAGIWGPPTAGALVVAYLIPHTSFPNVVVLALFSTACALSGSKVYAFAEGGHQTLVAAVLLPAVMLIGPVPAVLTGLVGIVLYQIGFLRRTFDVAAQSVGQRSVSILVAGAAWSTFLTGSLVMTRPSPAPRGDSLLPATVVIVLVYALASALQVSVRYASRRNVPLLWVLRANGLWDVVGTVCVGTCGLAIALPLAGVSYRSELPTVGPVLFVSVVALLTLFHLRALGETAQLRDAVADLLRAPTFDELLRQLANRVVRIAKPDLLWIVLNRTGDPPRVAVAEGVGPDVVERLLTEDGGASLGWTLAVRHTEWIDDYRTHARRSVDLDRIVGEGRIRSLVVAPLVFGTEVVGTLAVSKPVPSYFTATQVQSMTVLSAQAALTMRNAALLGEVSRARDELEALAEASQALNRSLELRTVLDGLVSVTCRRFGYARAMIALLGANNDLTVRSVVGGQVTLGACLSDDDLLEVAVVRRGLAMRASDPSPKSCAGWSSPGVALAVPIMRDGETIGAFSVGVDPPGVLAARDERVLTTLAGYAAVAIEHASLYEQTRELATTDGLTSLLNHRAFWQAIRREVERARRYAFPVSLVIVEIDRFKRYNDAYGHLKGDEVLGLVARTLERELREVDTVYRYGGDEFMLLLPQTTCAAARVVAERVRQDLETTAFIVASSRPRITASLGVATFPDDGDDADAVLQVADRRMYAAKRAGGNSVVCATA